MENCSLVHVEFCVKTLHLGTRQCLSCMVIASAVILLLLTASTVIWIPDSLPYLI